MGFTPGDYKDTGGNGFHIELKSSKHTADGQRIVFWNHNESAVILEITRDTAKELLRDLELLSEMTV